MKKDSFLILGFIVASYSSKAQVVFSQNNIPTPNSTVYSAVDTVPILQPGSTGANISWDFSNLGNHRLDTTSYIPSIGTPYSNNFPSSNIALLVSKKYTYFQSNTGELKQLGIAGDLKGTGHNGVALYKPALLLQKAPFNFNDTFKDSTQYNSTFYFGKMISANYYIDSLRVKNKTITITSYDGYGTLKTPIKPYPNVGRLKTRQISTDSLDIYKTSSPGGLGQWEKIQGSTTITDNYLWFTDNLNTPLVELAFTGNGKAISAKYLLDAANNIATITKNLGIYIYPNPAVNELTINYDDNNKEALLSIYNTLGQFITQLTIPANSSTKLDLSNYTIGIYTYLLTNKINGTPLATGRFSVVR